MFSFSAVVIALLLIPTFVCILILRLFFPKNTLKIHEAHLIPFGLGITLLCNKSQIFTFIELLTPPCCLHKDAVDQYFIENLLKQKTSLLIEYLHFLFTPVVIFSVLIAFLYFTWRSHFTHPKTNKCLDFFRGWIVRLVDDVLVNYMGKMTAYSPKTKMLFVDILDNSDSLYSGIFYDYFIEDKKLVGIQLSNVIRYSFKSEGLRKGSETHQPEPTSQGKYPDPYLLPNNGNMFFPLEKIQNFHFWTLKKGHSEIIDLKRSDKQVRFAWLLGIRYSLPHLNFNFTGHVFDEDTEANFSSLLKSFNTLGLPMSELAANVEFRKRTPSSSEKAAKK